MATFYVLPSRPLLGSRLATFLRDLLPDVSLAGDRWADLADELVAATLDCDNMYVVYAEDLPAGVGLEESLAAGFGAEPGDEIVEIRLGQGPKPASIQRRRLAA